MFKKALAIVFAICLVGSAQAVEIADVQIPELLEKDGVSLELNGAGIRSKFFMDIYVSALYLEHKSQDFQLILREDKPMAIRLHIVSGLIDKDKLKDAIEEGFDNATGGNTGPIQSQIDQFMALMETEVNKGDYFDFFYQPNEGIKIYKNQSYMNTVQGLNFKRAFFGIWLGDEPADDDLKEEMLGL